MMGEFGPWHIVIVLLVFALLFGGKRLPDAARGLGQSLRILKREMNAVAEPAQSHVTQPESAPTTPAQPPADQAPPALAAPVPAQPTPEPVAAAPARPADHA